MPEDHQAGDLPPYNPEYDPEINTVITGGTCSEQAVAMLILVIVVALLFLPLVLAYPPK